MSAPTSDAVGAALPALLSEAGRAADGSVGEFLRLATAVQRQRSATGVSDTDRITRSTALWVLMQVDPEVAAVLERAGVNEQRLADILTIRTIPPPATDGDAELHPDLADAVRAYLSAMSSERPIGTADLAIAVLQSTGDESVGLLTKRLRDLGNVNVTFAVGELERLANSRSSADGPSSANSPADGTAETWPAFSESVRGVRDRLGPEALVTPSEIAAGLQAMHSEYGGRLFGSVTLRPSVGTRATTSQWLDRVAGLYDPPDVQGSRHRVIDGELAVLGLAELDAGVAADLRSNGFLDELRREAGIRPRQVRADRTEWATDAPADQDLLGRDRLAQALVERVKLLAAPGGSSTRSFLVHVDGPWGAGKSTLFGFLERRLHDEEFVVVRVNAWQEQRVGVQWWTLLNGLRKAVKANTAWYRRPMLWFAGLWDRIRAAWVPFGVVVLVIVAVMLGLLGVVNIDLTTSADRADSLLKILSLATTAIAGLVAATRFLLPASRKSARIFVDSSDNPMQEVGRLFARTLARSPGPVVFLIDDLDRCDEEYVVEFMEVVQTLVRDAPDFLSGQGGRRKSRKQHAGPYAFVAADGHWIRSSYEHHYATFGATGVPGRPLGYLFQEKIFQLHVRLPAITETVKKRYLESLLAPRGGNTGPVDAVADAQRADDARAAVQSARSEAEVVNAAKAATNVNDPVARMELLGDAAVKFSERSIDDSTGHDLAPFARFLEPNPRSMKLFVNTYGVLRSLRTLEEVFVDIGPLALWTVMEIRWPYLADFLRTCPGAADGSSDEPIPPDVQPLLGDDDVEAVLKDTTAGPLTPALIRECSGAG